MVNNTQHTSSCVCPFALEIFVYSKPMQAVLIPRVCVCDQDKLFRLLCLTWPVVVFCCHSQYMEACVFRAAPARVKIAIIIFPSTLHANDGKISLFICEPLVRVVVHEYGLAHGNCDTL